jgi:hypothetical protein
MYATNVISLYKNVFKCLQQILFTMGNKNSNHLLLLKMFCIF